VKIHKFIFKTIIVSALWLTSGISWLGAAGADSAAQPATPYEWHVVREVLTGDSFKLDTGTQVTYSSISAPPLQHADPKVREYAKKALAFNQELLLGKKIRVEFGSQIKNEDGVYQGFIYLEDGTLANLRMIEAGYAKLRIIPPNLQHAKELRYASGHARHDGKGLWEYENKVVRRFIYMADKMTRKFHFVGCRHLRGVSKAHLEKYESSVDAKAAGFQFCAECRHTYAQETDLF
jgi:endonuclease YncB( thermonuclease family)